LPTGCPSFPNPRLSALICREFAFPDHWLENSLPEIEKKAKAKLRPGLRFAQE